MHELNLYTRHKAVYTFYHDIILLYMTYNFVSIVEGYNGIHGGLFIYDEFIVKLYTMEYTISVYSLLGTSFPKVWIVFND